MAPSAATSSDREFIAGLLNAFLWGAGELIQGRLVTGALWMTTFFLANLPLLYPGYAFYVTTAPGNALLIGHLGVSAAMLYSAMGPDVRSIGGIAAIKENWVVFIVISLATGMLQEIANELYLGHWWTYLFPWDLFALPGSRMGPLLLIGWAVMVAIIMLTAFVIARHVRMEFLPAWIVSWMAFGFVVETFNALVWRTWHYAPGTLWKSFPVPGLDYSILVPVIGYGGTSILSY
ncbi:MAG TPA: hypothetical protein VGK13_03200, partial [Methanocellaceae archaeon]